MTDQVIKVCDNCWHKDKAPGAYPCRICNEEDKWEDGVAFIDKTEEGKAVLGFKGKLEDVIKKSFNLDKLIDDHWQYLGGLIDVTQQCKNPKEKSIAEYHYKTAAKHFWKHCCEHYGIKEK